MQFIFSFQKLASICIFQHTQVYFNQGEATRWNFTAKITTDHKIKRYVLIVQIDVVSIKRSNRPSTVANHSATKSSSKIAYFHPHSSKCLFVISQCKHKISDGYLLKKIAAKSYCSVLKLLWTFLIKNRFLIFHARRLWRELHTVQQEKVEAKDKLGLFVFFHTSHVMYWFWASWLETNATVNKRLVSFCGKFIHSCVNRKYLLVYVTIKVFDRFLLIK